MLQSVTVPNLFTNRGEGPNGAKQCLLKVFFDRENWLHAYSSLAPTWARLLTLGYAHRRLSATKVIRLSMGTTDILRKLNVTGEICSNTGAQGPKKGRQVVDETTTLTGCLRLHVDRIGRLGTNLCNPVLTSRSLDGAKSPHANPGRPKLKIVCPGIVITCFLPAST